MSEPETDAAWVIDDSEWFAYLNRILQELRGSPTKSLPDEPTTDKQIHNSTDAAAQIDGDTG